MIPYTNVYLQTWEPKGYDCKCNCEYGTDHEGVIFIVVISHVKEGGKTHFIMCIQHTNKEQTISELMLKLPQPWVVIEYEVENK